MPTTKTSATLLVVVLLFVASGAHCRHFARQYTQPRTLPESATLEQIVHQVNSNTSLIRSAQTTQATLRVDGVPAGLKTNLAIESPKRLRMHASLMGPQIDLGSNDEAFWVWIRHSEPKAMFVCRHDQFAQSNARHIMPIEPERLLESIGLPWIDPTLVTSQPMPVGTGRIEIRLRQPSANGEMQKTIVVDSWDGMVLEQHLYDSQGALLVTSLTSRYKPDPATGAKLPRSIEIRWPTTKMSFTLDITDWAVNNIASENTSLWAMPVMEGYPIVDLADPSIRFVDPNSPQSPIPPGTHPVSTGPPASLPPVAPPIEVPSRPIGGIPEAGGAPAYPGPTIHSSVYPSSQPVGVMNSQ